MNIKNNKGFSLIEILVSLAILGILIIPISNLVNISIKTNSKSDTKQQAVLIGQQILEQIQVLSDGDEYENNVGMNKIILPSGEELNGTNSDYEFKNLKYTTNMEVENKKYSVNVTLNKNSSIEHNYGYIDGGDSEEATPSPFSPDVTLEIDTDDENNIIVKQKDSSKQVILEDTKITNRIEMKIMQELSGGYKKISIDGTDICSNIDCSIILLHFTENFTLDNKELDVDVYNNITDGLELQVKRSYNGKEKIYINNKQGKLKVINNIIDDEEIENRKIHNFYNIKVEVAENKKVLFSSSANKNLKISR